MPISAGSMVSATTTDSATVAAAATPITVRKGMPVMNRPTSAMITVSPAKMTALPEVARDLPIDSCTSSPWASWSRWRERMNRA